MDKNDIEFLEQYKRLEVFCSEAFSAQHGVSEYISCMDENYNEGQRKVSDWKNSYRTIKRLRWLRNQIVHEENRAAVTSNADLIELTDFYNILLNRTDPISLLYAEKNKESKTMKAKTEKKETEIEYAPKSKSGGRAFAAIVIAAAVILFGYIIVNYFM